MNNLPFLNINIGFRCNYNCPFCLIKFTKDENLIKLSKNKEVEFNDRDLYNLYHYIIKKKVKRIIFCTGEPFLYKNNLYKICNFIKKHTNILEISIYTNSSLMNKYDYKYFKYDYLKISFQSISKRIKKVILNRYILRHLKLIINRVVFINEKEWFKDIIELKELMSKKIEISNDLNTTHLFDIDYANLFLYNYNSIINRDNLNVIYFTNKVYLDSIKLKINYNKYIGIYLTKKNTNTMSSKIYNYISKMI